MGAPIIPKIVLVDNGIEGNKVMMLSENKVIIAPTKKVVGNVKFRFAVFKNFLVRKGAMIPTNPIGPQ